MGLQASLADSSLFILRRGKLVVYLLVYVDDIVLTRNDPQFLTFLISQLCATFELKDLGSLNYFLGLQITRTLKGLFLSQTKYALDLLLRHNMHTSKPTQSLVLLTSGWFPMSVLFFPILISTKVWLVLSIVSPSLVLI